MIPVALTIAGSDPSGGAGIQADLKTFHQYGVYGTSVLTLLTVQNTCRSGAVEYLSARFVLGQLDAVLEDLPPQAAKTGALGSAQVIDAIASRAADFTFPLVVDPVMIGKHGALLMAADAQAILRSRLLPHVYLITPNVEEAMTIAGLDATGPASVEDAARAIADMGVRNVLITGLGTVGIPSDSGAARDDATDVLFSEGCFHRFTSKRVDTRHTHGTGCTYSAAITAELANGKSLPDAVASAKRYITRAIETNPSLGRGQGPVNHWASR